MRTLLEAAAARSIGYLEGLEARGVAPTPEALAALAAFDTPLPEGPTAPEQVLATLDELGSPATVASAGGRYFGFVIGGALPVGLAANWLASSWDQNAVLHVTSPAAATVEAVALKWLLDLFHLPPTCGGAFVTGATVANFTALAAARHHVLARAGWNVAADGLNGAPPVTVVASAEAHPTLFKAVGLLGLGISRVIRVPVDAQGRMRADMLPPPTDLTIVCTQAGNVNTGAFDPVGEVCERAQAARAWVHVDGAFGLWAAAAPARMHLAGGIALADSWATDFHKWLNVPYDNGLALVRHPESLGAAMTVTAEYLPADVPVRHPSHFTPELSRRARGVDVWAVLKSLGRGGVADLVEGCCRHAARFAELLRAAGYVVLNDVVLNQVLVSFGDAATTRRVVERLQADGVCWCGATEWQGRPAMRISVSSWATTSEDVRRSVDAIVRCAREA